MPHLVILYTPNLEKESDLSALCRALADTMLSIRDDDEDEQVFPPGGTRVLAFPAAHYAVADDGAAGRAAGGSGDYAFVYLNLRMGSGRSKSVQERTGEALLAKASAHFAPLFAKRHLGITLQIDEGHEVYNAKHSNLHPLFS
jgi:5-carboxymethyl-2-hydroxymuconate isomerase